MKIHLGCGDKIMGGWVNVDRRELPGVNLVTDLSQTPWPLPDNVAEAIKAEHILEHMPDPIAFLDECYRIARDGCYIQLEVPHWKHHYAHGMPDHRTTWAHNSFDRTYVTDGRFQLVFREARIFGDRWTGRLVPPLCKWTPLVSGLRFILLVEKSR